MADVFTANSSSFDKIKNYLGDVCPSITWNTQVIKVIPSEARRAKRITEGGFQLESDLSLVATAADFGDGQPLPLQTFTYSMDSRTYRIDSVNRLPGGLLLELDCNDPNRGA